MQQFLIQDFPIPRYLSKLAHPYVYWLVLLGSALLSPLAFAPYRLFWLMPLLFGIILILTLVRPAISIRSVYLWFLVSYLIQFYWVYIAMHDISKLPAVYAVPLTVLFPAYLAIFPALCFWILEKLPIPVSWRTVLALPVLWTLIEYIRLHALTGFGWGELGYSQISESPLAGYAPVGGIHLVTWSVVFIATLLVWGVISQSLRGRLVAFLCTIVVFVLGGYLKSIEFTVPDKTSATVALAQGNIPQTIKWQPEQLNQTIQHYYNQIANTHADIMILPETAIPVIYESLPENIVKQFVWQANHNGTALAIGIVKLTPDKTGYLNTVVNLQNYNQDSGEPTYYAKRHLVPFGEFIPFSQWLGWLYNMAQIPLSILTPGIQSNPLNLAGHKVAFNICYEDGFGDELIASARQANLLANVSNMAWFGQSYARDQQLQLSQARALELGRYMVRATNTGMTAIINQKGQIQALLPPDVEQVLIGEVQGYVGETPYMRWGGSTPWICLGVGWLLILLCGQKILMKRKSVI